MTMRTIAALASARPRDNGQSRETVSMRFYWPIAKVDAARRMVWGYASTEAEDDQGETVTRGALAAALDDYMRFANIREMHQNSAIGVAQEADIDDKGLYVGAKIVDDDAWRKVVEGVYKGFSIGGRVTARDGSDRKVITGLKLTEISVVDRPANPEAMFDCWKLAADPAMASDGGDDEARTLAPVQIWDCGIAGHRHLAKAEAMRCIGPHGGDIAKLDAEPRDSTKPDPAGAPDHGVVYADPGYCPDRLKRYPIDSEAHIRAAWAFIHQADNAQHYTSDQLDHIKARIVAAWRAQIDGNGPPAASAPSAGGMTSAEPDRLARLAVELAPLADGLAKLAADIVPRLEALQKRVDEIAGTPLPPQTAARGFAGLSKREDDGPRMTAPDDIVAALARMSDEERTLTLIKAAHANPIRASGLVTR